MTNLSMVRSLFPLLQNHPELAYLDSAASAQKPQAVLDAMQQFQTHSYANIHRGLYGLSQAATQAYEEARQTVARFINAPVPEHVIFTRNTTGAINTVARSWAKQNLNAGDAVLVTVLEHHANLVPWQLLAAELGLEIVVADCTDDGGLGLAEVQAVWQDNIKLVACTHMSNVLGTIPDVANIIAFAHGHGAKVLVDGSQMVVHGPVDVQALEADFYVFTGHKLYGPSGIGVLYLAADVAVDIPPYEGGGDMIEHVQLPTGTTFAPLPARLEAGTPPITEAIGLAAAIDFVQQFETADVQAHEAQLADAAISGLQAIPGVTVYGTATPRASVVSFGLEDVHPQDVAMILDQCHVAVRTGRHCADPLIERLGLCGTIRASFSLYNTMADVEKLLAAVTQAKKMLT